MMDLYVAVAIPPYNELLGGKLLCYMMVSNEVRAAFRRKYEPRFAFEAEHSTRDLALLVTTSVFGLNSSQYNRLNYLGRRLYFPIGLTIGFGSLHFSEATFSALRTLLLTEGKTLESGLANGGNWKFRVIREALDRLGFDADQVLQHGHSRGVYVAPLAENAREYLRGEDGYVRHLDLPLACMISHWKSTWLTRRAMNTAVLNRVKSFDFDSLSLTRLLA
jgi:hypothetical protein